MNDVCVLGAVEFEDCADGVVLEKSRRRFVRLGDMSPLSPSESLLLNEVEMSEEMLFELGVITMGELQAHTKATLDEVTTNRTMVITVTCSVSVSWAAMSLQKEEWNCFRLSVSYPYCEGQGETRKRPQNVGLDFSTVSLQMRECD